MICLGPRYRGPTTARQCSSFGAYLLQRLGSPCPCFDDPRHIANVPEAPKEKIKEFLADPSWQFPAFGRVKARALHRVFDVRRTLADDSSKLKGSCSEFLGLFGLLRHWIEVEAPLDEAFTPHKRSFAKLCGVLDLILQVKRGTAIAREASRRLAADCCEFLRLHKATGFA